MRIGFLICLLVAALPGCLGSQEPRSSERAIWHIGPFVGFAANSRASSLLGVTEGYDHLFLGVHARTPILRVPGFRFAYIAQLLPVVRLQGPDEEERPPAGFPVTAMRTSYALGVVPFGLELATIAWRRITVFGAAAAGGLVFGHPFPVADGERINFTLEYGGGLHVATVSEQRLVLGYRYHHISNAWYARSNPGLDGHVLYAGYEWAVSARRE